MDRALRRLDVQFELESALIDTDNDYVALQKDQMLHGLANDGAQIGKYRSDDYAQKKSSMNALPGYGNVDLRYTGDFQSGIFAEARSDGFVVDSLDQKSNMLMEKYGDRIFTLEDNHKQQYIDLLRPVLVENVVKSINQAK